jgi:hypothetical protein
MTATERIGTLTIRLAQGGHGRGFCNWFTCERGQARVGSRRPAQYVVEIHGRPAGQVCRQHRAELVAVWDDAHDVQAKSDAEPLAVAS